MSVWVELDIFGWSIKLYSWSEKTLCKLTEVELISVCCQGDDIHERLLIKRSGLITFGCGLSASILVMMHLRD